MAASSLEAYGEHYPSSAVSCNSCTIPYCVSETFHYLFTSRKYEYSAYCSGHCARKREYQKNIIVLAMLRCGISSLIWPQGLSTIYSMGLGWVLLNKLIRIVRERLCVSVFVFG